MYDLNAIYEDEMSPETEVECCKDIDEICAAKKNEVFKVSDINVQHYKESEDMTWL